MIARTLSNLNKLNSSEMIASIAPACPTPFSRRACRSRSAAFNAAETGAAIEYGLAAMSMPARLLEAAVMVEAGTAERREVDRWEL
jgi:hypothetical protein